MDLRTKLGWQIVAGTAALIAITGALRSAIAQRELVASATAAARTAADDVLWEIDHRQEQLIARLTRPAAVAARGDFATTRTDAAWRAIVEHTGLSPRETLVAISPSGEILDAEGDLAGDHAAMAEMLTARAFAGDLRSDRLRTGVLTGGDHVLVAASAALIPTSTEAAADENLRGVSPRLSRLALIVPLSTRPLLSGRRDLSIQMYAFDSATLPGSLRSASADLWRTEGHRMELTSSGAREIRTVGDGGGRPAFVLSAHANADIGTLIPKHVLDNLLWEALVAALAVAIALRFIHSNVLRPIDQIKQQASRLARSEHGQLAFRGAGPGPLGELTGALDAMLKKIEVERSQFVRNARIAGMSDVSMGVVHSAGNILNSVNISMKLLMRELKTIEIDDLNVLVCELKDHSDDLDAYIKEDENGRFSLPFLSAMTNALSEVRARCLVEVEAVDRGVAHVVDLIRSQEKYAIGASVVEPSDVTEIVEMALQVASMTIEGSESIIIDRAFADLTPARIDRHRLTSILINLLSNAIEALLAEGDHERLLEIATYPMDGERFVIEIADTGIGIAPENLDLIFTSAFTTKAGASGEGLHTTANVCRELGIAIGAVSQGSGCGCTFKLRVPYDPPGEHDGQTPLSGRLAIGAAEGEASAAPFAPLAD